MAHRSVTGEFRLGHRKPWSSVTSVGQTVGDSAYEYFVVRSYLTNVLKRQLFLDSGVFLSDVSLKGDADGIVLNFEIYWSRLNLLMRKYLVPAESLYRKKIRKDVAIGFWKRFLLVMGSVRSVIQWILRGWVLGVTRFCYNNHVSQVSVWVLRLFAYLDGTLEEMRMVRHSDIRKEVWGYLSGFFSPIIHSVRRLVDRRARLQFRFVRENSVGASAVGRYMGWRLSLGYPIQVVFGFLIKRLRKRYKKLKFSLIFGMVYPNCLGYHFQLSGRVSRKLRARTMKRRAGKLHVSDHGWLPSYESVQVKTKYGTSGLRVWLLYKFQLPETLVMAGLHI